MSRNLLDGETSPYLLQHRLNPVHWRPWTAAALAEAKAENKPILLSVGYAACHWCHVMAHESFENEETARLINELYIPIKVDREERPDIDAIYQRALAMLGEQGGWPLTMFLTPSAEPFWGGTYFPPRASFGRPGFREVLAGVGRAYRDAPDQIATSVATLMAGLSKQGPAPDGRGIGLPLLDRAAQAATNAIDKRWGGLGGAPKFPHVPLLTLIWRAALRAGTVSGAVTLTLDRMSLGGIYDHLGGGYARYSTDPEWFAPHFEKMLYDNAQLVELLTLVWQTTHNPLYADRVAETLAWLTREMLAEGDAFAATLDADSEGKEGRYYVWTESEIDAALPPGLAPPFKRAYGVLPHGNWEDGRSILHRNHPEGENPPDLSEARALLLAARQNRILPGRDDKILADWNGMMIAAMANAGMVFARPDWVDAAKRAFFTVCHLLGQNRGRLGHSYRAGRRQTEAMLDDYAQMARAALVLSEVTLDPSFIAHAETWAAIAEEHFHDARSGGYFFTADDAPDLIVRTKTAQDAATPSGNGIMAEVLARLYHLTGNTLYRHRAEETVAAFAPEIEQSFVGLASLLNAWEHLAEAVQIVMIGTPSALGAMMTVIAAQPLPTRVLTVLAPGEIVPAFHPAAGKTAAPGVPTVFVCKGQTCSLPVTQPPMLQDVLARR